MTVRKEVAEFVALGPLPDSSADATTVARHEEYLHRIQKPVSDDEARVLLQAFGPDDCFGLAWTLVHLVESAPGEEVLPDTKPAETDNRWIRQLWERAQRSKSWPKP